MSFENSGGAEHSLAGKWGVFGQSLLGGVIMTAGKAAFALHSGRGARAVKGWHQPENSAGIYCKLNSCYRMQDKGCCQKLLSWIAVNEH